MHHKNLSLFRTGLLLAAFVAGLWFVRGATAATSVGVCPFVASVTASGSWEQGVPDNAFDCDDATQWNSGGYSGTIRVEFAAPVTFNGIEITSHASPETNVTYNFSGSNDGVTWDSLLSTTLLVPQATTTHPVISLPASVTYRYLRVDAPTALTWIAIDELRLTREEPACLATASVSATSNYAPLGVPDNAFDCDEGTEWNSGGNTGSITVDYGSLVTASGFELTVHARPDSNVTYLFLGSDDGVAYHPITQATLFVLDGAHTYPVIDISPPVSFRYLRVDASSAGTWIGVDEIWVHPAAPPAPIDWANPAAINYGTPLGAAQLNASHPLSGTFTYSPPAGTILEVGTGQPLSVVFTPDDPAVPPLAANVTIDVGKGNLNVDVQTTAESITAGDFIRLSAFLDSPTPGAAAPTGTVSFYDSGQLLGSAALNQGVAAIYNPLLLPGTHKISATYEGDSHYRRLTSRASEPETVIFVAPISELYVAPGGDDSGNCQSSAAPCATIQRAVNAAYGGETISVAPGTYYENLTVGKNVSIIGSPSGETIVDGNRLGRVFTIQSGAQVTLENMTIQRGVARGTPNPGWGARGGDGLGGGIYNLGDLTLQNVAISSNYAEGGMGNTGEPGDPGELRGTAISPYFDWICGGICPGWTPSGGRGGTGGAGGDALGGGIYNAGSLAAFNTTISYNFARGGNGGYGGRGGPGGGGGSGWEGSSGTVDCDGTITGAYNGGPGGPGGTGGPGGLAGVPGYGYGAGIFNAGSFSGVNLTFDHNQSITGRVSGPGTGGLPGRGGYPGSGGQPYTRECSFLWWTWTVWTGRTSSGQWGRTGSYGPMGGVPSYPAYMGGGALYNRSYASFSFMNSIIVAEDVRQSCYAETPLISNDYNLMRLSANCPVTGSTANTLTTVDPLLGPFQNNGGGTYTLALLDGSPAIDGGTCTGAPDTDQRGLPRPSAANPACDMGTFEVQLADTVAITETVYMTGTYEFGSTGVVAEVESTGDLSELVISPTQVGHPAATAGIEGGAFYWHIDGLTADGQPATNFNISLTLPHNNLPDPKICRWDGSAWDCGRDSFTSTTVTRSNITGFSDWAVADGVGPAGQAKVDPTLSWASPADIVYGTPLGAGQLNASADIAGSFVFSPTAGTILATGADQVLSATFTPDDPELYNAATVTATINVIQATPVINWANPAAITYGSPLSASELNAGAAISGTMAYSPTEGTILDAGTGQTLSLTFYPADSLNYRPATAEVEVDVLQAAATAVLSSSASPVVFGQPVELLLAVAPAAGNPTHMSGGVAIAQGNSAVAGGQIAPSGLFSATLGTLPVGQHRFSATYDGSQNYAASSTSLTVEVVRAGTAVTLASSATSAGYGEPVSLSAVVSVVAPGAGAPSGSVTFKEGATVLGTVPLDAAGEASLTLSDLAVGGHAITADYSGDGSFNGSSSPAVSQTVLDNQPPSVSLLALSTNPLPVGAAAGLTANVDDSSSLGSDIAAAEYSLDGGQSWSPMSAPAGFTSPQVSVEAGVGPFPAAEVYQVCVRGTDAAGNISGPACLLLAVYDANGGFVTGGGWIWSAAGACRFAALCDSTAEGKANFGFVSRYQHGATVPTGNTRFVFKAGGINFQSDTYEWLVVTGSDYARYKGAGTINGDLAPNNTMYKFQIWAGDGTGSGGDDTFRIKIWYEDNGTVIIIYDNGVNQAVGGGNIKVHD